MRHVPRLGVPSLARVASDLPPDTSFPRILREVRLRISHPIPPVPRLSAGGSKAENYTLDEGSRCTILRGNCENVFS
jgi:hypothetical protein